MHWQLLAQGFPFLGFVRTSFYMWRVVLAFILWGFSCPIDGKSLCHHQRISALKQRQNLHNIQDLQPAIFSSETSTLKIAIWSDIVINILLKTFFLFNAFSSKYCRIQLWFSDKISLENFFDLWIIKMLN